MAKKINKQLVYLIIGCWIVLQFFLLNRQFKKEEFYHTETKRTIAYIKKIAPKLSEDSIVIVPTFLSDYGAGFCNLFYGKSKTLFLPFYSKIEWLAQYGRQFDPTKDIILSYDDEKQMVIDRTKEYKSIIIEKQSK